jgi:hypothetical protein
MSEALEDVALPALQKMIEHVKNGDISSLVIIGRLKPGKKMGAFVNSCLVTSSDTPHLVFILSKIKYEMLKAIDDVIEAENEQNPISVQ